MLGRAETGSGKTLAFGLPMLSRLAEGSERPRPTAPHGLVLVPTRELAEQVATVLQPIARQLGLLVMTVYGGVPIGRQIDRLRRGADVVVATPGRLIDLMERRACTLADVRVTVLDEADHMADLGFLPSVTRILDATPDGGQRLLFSATLDRGVGQIVRSYLSGPALHAVVPRAIAGGAAEHRTLVLDPADKVPVAAEMAGRPARSLFFVPDQARRRPARPAAGPGGRPRRGYSRRSQPGSAAARPGRLRGRPPTGAGGHRRGRAGDSRG